MGVISRYLTLIKPRPTGLALITVMMGFVLASAHPVNLPLLFLTILFAFLVGSAANAFNQWLEKEWDARMIRTHSRAIPMGAISPQEALFFSVALAIFGIAGFFLFINIPAGWIALILIVSYSFVYTPLKRITPMSLHVGAFSGALPPLLGWTAAGQALGWEAVSLFAILYLWQIPHFLGIAWIYRVDYEKAGFQMLSVRDPEGGRVARQALVYTLFLAPVSIAPFFLSMAGPAYAAVVMFCDAVFLFAAFRFAVKHSEKNARGLVTVSVIYLCALMLGITLDKV